MLEYLGMAVHRAGTDLMKQLNVTETTAVLNNGISICHIDVIYIHKHGWVKRNPFDLRIRRKTGILHVLFYYNLASAKPGKPYLLLVSSTTCTCSYPGRGSVRSVGTAAMLRRVDLPKFRYLDLQIYDCLT